MKTISIVLLAVAGFALGACTTTEERISGAAVGAAVAGPVGAAAGAAVGPSVADELRR